MSLKKPTSIKDLIIHIGLALGLSALIVITIFYIWLPITTNHGESITVPDVRGVAYEQLADVLGKRNLRYEVTKDSSYSPDYAPLAVLRQVPAPNTQVKENRKIYVTLNTSTPPMVKFPGLTDKSLKAAQMVLKSYDLKLGRVKYTPDPLFGTVHEARMKGREVLEGENIEKGSTIDLLVGDGYGNTIFQSPSLTGLDLEEAVTVVIGTGLKVGKISFTTKEKAAFEVSDSIQYRNIPVGSIQNQYPRKGKRVKIGDPVDLWVYKPDSLTVEGATILDGQ